MLFLKAFLHRMKLIAISQAFDGFDFSAARLDRQHRAGFYRAAIEMHRAGAALAGIATDMGTG